MFKGCLKAFVYCLVFVTLMIIFTGGSVDIGSLFGYALFCIIAYGLVYMVIYVIRHFFKN